MEDLPILRSMRELHRQNLGLKFSYYGWHLTQEVYEFRTRNWLLVSDVQN
jgi:hypothetical protein